MAGCEDDGGDRQQDRPAHYSAQQEQKRGNDGQRQRPENAAFSKAHKPDQAVERRQQAVCDEIGREGLVRRPFACSLIRRIC